jgi:vitamin B12 transporter
VPTLQDLYYPGYSNPNLLPEKTSDSDATILFNGARGSLSVGWFGRSGSNFIVLDPTTFIPYNAQRAQTAGIAITARSKPIHGLVADASFTDLYRALDLTTFARLPRSPVGQASAGITRPFGATRSAFGLRFGVVGSDGDDTANVPPPLVGRYDSYTSIDAYYRYKLSRGGILTIRGFNLGDDREAPIFGYPNVGRRVVVELSTR